MLGPPADAIGEALKRYVERRTVNVGKILENADAKLGNRRDSPGEVPYRVAGRILEEGSYCDEPIVVEYLGGVLASSRSGISRDDRGARWVSLVAQMSAYEIRLHYLTYAAARQACIASARRNEWGGQTIGGLPPANRLVLVDNESLTNDMDFAEGENAAAIMSEAIGELARLGLIDPTFGSVTPEFGRTQFKRVVERPMLLVQPNISGIHLFLYAHGRGGEAYITFDDPEMELALPGLAIPPAWILDEMPAAT